MAKTSSIERNKKRERLVKKYAARRAKLRAAALNEDLPLAGGLRVLRVQGPQEPLEKA